MTVLGETVKLKVDSLQYPFATSHKECSYVDYPVSNLSFQGKALEVAHSKDRWKSRRARSGREKADQLVSRSRE